LKLIGERKILKYRRKKKGNTKLIVAIDKLTKDIKKAKKNE